MSHDPVIVAEMQRLGICKPGGRGSSCTASICKNKAHVMKFAFMHDGLRELLLGIPQGSTAAERLERSQIQIERPGGRRRQDQPLNTPAPVPWFHTNLFPATSAVPLSTPVPLPQDTPLTGFTRQVRPPTVPTATPLPTVPGPFIGVQSQGTTPNQTTTLANASVFGCLEAVSTKLSNIKGQRQLVSHTNTQGTLKVPQEQAHTVDTEAFSCIGQISNTALKATGQRLKANKDEAKQAREPHIKEALETELKELVQARLLLLNSISKQISVDEFKSMLDTATLSTKVLTALLKEVKEVNLDALWMWQEAIDTCLISNKSY